MKHFTHYFTLTVIFLAAHLTLFSQNGRFPMNQFMGINVSRIAPLDKVNCVGFIREFHEWAPDEGDEYNPTTCCASAPYPNNLYRWNPPYQGQTETQFDYFYDELNAKGLTLCATMNLALPGLVIASESDPMSALKLAQMQRKPVQFLDENNGGDEDGELPMGIELEDPINYIERADYLYQFASRYGVNSNPPDCRLKYAAGETLEKGRGNIQYIEDWNEPDKFWLTEFDLLPQEFQFTAREYAAMASADYDGHGDELRTPPTACDNNIDENGNSYGYAVGVNNVTTQTKFVNGAPYKLDWSWIMDMNQYFIDRREDDKFIFDVINFHEYFYEPGTAGINNGTWISPEQYGIKEELRNIVDLKNGMGWQEKELWLSEFGYDTNQENNAGPTALNGNGPDFELFANYSVENLQAIWTVRSYLEIAAGGFDRAMAYNIQDDSAMPIAAWDRNCGLLNLDGAPKEAWFYVSSMKNILKGYKFAGEFPLDNCDGNEFGALGASCDGATQCARIYKFEGTNNPCDIIWAIWSPTSCGYNYEIPFTFECNNGVTGIELVSGSVNGQMLDIDVANGEAMIPVSETPIFIVEKELEVPQCPDVTVVPMTTTCTSVKLYVDIPVDANYNSYQIWYGLKTNIPDSEAPDFSASGGNVTLFQNDVPINQTTISVAGLEAGQTYNFYVIPQTDSGIPMIPLFGDFPKCGVSMMTIPSGANVCKIENFTIHLTSNNLPSGPTAEEGELFDQQNLDFCNGLPDLSNGLIYYPWVDFQSDEVIPGLPYGVDIVIDLEQPYLINQFYLYDGTSGGQLDFNWSESLTGPWQPLTTYFTSELLRWETVANFSNPPQGVRYLQIVNNQNLARVKELFICGDPISQCSFDEVLVSPNCNSVNLKPVVSTDFCNTPFNVTLSLFDNFSTIYLEELLSGTTIEIPSANAPLGTALIPGVEYFYQVDADAGNGNSSLIEGSFIADGAEVGCFDYDPQLTGWSIGCHSHTFWVKNQPNNPPYKTIQFWYSEVGPFQPGEHPQATDPQAGTYITTLYVGSPPLNPWTTVTLSGLGNAGQYYIAYRMLDNEGRSTPMYIYDNPIPMLDCGKVRFFQDMGPFFNKPCQAGGIWWQMSKEMESLGGTFEIIETAKKTTDPLSAALTRDRVEHTHHDTYYYHLTNKENEKTKYVYLRWVSRDGFADEWIVIDLKHPDCSEGRSSDGAGYLTFADVFVHGLQLYPNPTEDALYLELADNRYQSYQIIDLMGRLRMEGMVEKEVQKMKLDVSHLQGGVYILQMEGEGIRVKSFRFVVSE